MKLILTTLLAVAFSAAAQPLPPAAPARITRTNYFSAIAVANDGRRSDPAIIATTQPTATLAWDYANTNGISFELRQGSRPGAITNLVWTGTALTAHWPPAMDDVITISSGASLVLTNPPGTRFYRAVQQFESAPTIRGPWTALPAGRPVLTIHRLATPKPGQGASTNH